MIRVNLTGNDVPAVGFSSALIIEHGRADRHYWRDLWHYRELFQVLAWCDISVRYKPTVIGAAKRCVKSKSSKIGGDSLVWELMGGSFGFRRPAKLPFAR